MKKLSETQIANLKDAKSRGVTESFLFCTRYVCLFSVDKLLADDFLSSYWYRNLGVTETRVLHDVAERLLNF